MKTLLLLCALSSFAVAAEKAPVPAALSAAKTAFVINDGTWLKAYDKFYAELHQWNYFTLVDSEEKADILIILSQGKGQPVLAETRIGDSRFKGFIAANRFQMTIVDAKDGHRVLWTDSGGESALVSNSAKKFVKNLKERMAR